MSSSPSSRNEQTCQRCFSREYIPTYQFVKFDTRVHYLCQKCWEDFRSWFHWGRRPVETNCGHHE